MPADTTQDMESYPARLSSSDRIRLRLADNVVKEIKSILEIFYWPANLWPQKQATLLLAVQFSGYWKIHQTEIFIKKP